MERLATDFRLDTRAARQKLRKRREPYWRTLNKKKGWAIGYRKGARGGYWIAKHYSKDLGRRFNKIGRADDDIQVLGDDVLTYERAEEKARTWFAELIRSGGVKQSPYIVRDAIKDYLEDYLRRSGKGYSRMKASIYAHIIPVFGEIETSKLTQRKIKAWHEDISKTPARLRSRKGEERQYRNPPVTPEEIRKRRSTANKILTMFKSALNYGYQEGRIASNEAWVNVKPFKDVDAPKVRYLDDAESTRLVNACPADLRAMVTAALLTGARYGELARLTVNDFDNSSGTLYIATSKTGKDRHIALTDEGKTFFARTIAGKLGGDLIFLRNKGQPWGRAHQYRPLKEACAVAKIFPGIGFHILRHCYGSRLAMRGVPMAVIAVQLGHADTRITEKHYAHLGPSYVADTVRNAFDEIGLLEDDNVVTI